MPLYNSDQTYLPKDYTDCLPDYSCSLITRKISLKGHTGQVQTTDCSFSYHDCLNSLIVSFHSNPFLLRLQLSLQPPTFTVRAHSRFLTKTVDSKAVWLWRFLHGRRITLKMESLIYFQFGPKLRKPFSVCSAFLRVSHLIEGPEQNQENMYINWTSKSFPWQEASHDRPLPVSSWNLQREFLKQFPIPSILVKIWCPSRIKGKWRSKAGWEE